MVVSRSKGEAVVRSQGEVVVVGSQVEVVVVGSQGKVVVVESQGEVVVVGSQGEVVVPERGLHYGRRAGVVGEVGVGPMGQVQGLLTQASPATRGAAVKLNSLELKWYIPNSLILLSG